MDSIGLAKLEELAAAIAEFRRAGKKVIAHGSYFLESQYYLAAQADEVYLDPFGFVLLPATTAIACTSRTRSTSCRSTCTCSASVNSRAPPSLSYGATCRAEDRRGERAPTCDRSGRATATASSRAPSGSGGHQRLRQRLCRGRAPGGRRYRQGRQDAGLVERDCAPHAQIELRMSQLVGKDAERHTFNTIAYEDYLRVLKNQEQLAPQCRERRRRRSSPAATILDGKQPSGTDRW